MSRKPVGIVSLVLVVLAGQTVALIDAGVRSEILGLSLLVLDAIGVVVSLRAARRAERRTSWRLVAAARACSFLSTTCFAVAAATGDRSPAAWWAGAVAGILMFALMSAAALSVPVHRLRGRQAWAFVAEMMTVVVAGSMAIWYFVLRPLVENEASHRWVQQIGFPAGNLVLLAAVSAVLLRGAEIRYTRPTLTLFAGMLIYVFADVMYASLGAYGQTPTHHPLASGSLVLALLVMTVAAMWQSRTGSDPAPADRRRRRSAWPSHLPYLAIVFGNALMFAVTVREDQLMLWGGLVVGQIMMTGFLTLRQLISLRESRDLTLTDPLTRLVNRAGLDDALDRGTRRGEPIVLMLIDLDDFKLINDAYGHSAGDTVLTEFARLLGSGIRRDDVAARMGGDEFAVLFGGATAEQAATAAQRILAAAAASPVRLGDDVVPIRASIGIAAGAPGDSPTEILRRADVAMYQAKRAGNHGFQTYEKSMVDRRARDAALADGLAQALGAGQLHVLYQPLVDLTAGRPVAVEALIRWQHPTLGVVSPLEFVPIAERTALINPIGLWVLEQACRQVRTWQDAGARDVYASVNLSPRQLQEPNLVAEVLDVLRRTGLAARDLVLEVTESAIVDEQVAIPALRALREHGIRVAIDDFGTGYSSLHYLTRLPVDILKIDRSFVAELDGTSEGAAVTEAVIRLSQVLRLTTVAEGIETREHAAELRRLGCHIGQGYLFARPLPAGELDAMMTGTQALSSTT